MMDISTIQIVSYNGRSLNDGVNYKTIIDLAVPPVADAFIQEVRRADNTPVYAGKILNSRYLPIRVENISGSWSVLNALFNPHDFDEHTLIVKNTTNNSLWQVQAVT